jgi:hypothetical protein
MRQNRNDQLQPLSDIDENGTKTSTINVRQPALEPA